MKLYWKFLLTCRDGGYGWGETEAKAEMCAPGETIEEAKEFIRMHIPGGWTAKFVGRTQEDFYLRNL